MSAKPTPPHGTVARYVSKTLSCRCDACRRANADYSKAWQAAHPKPKKPPRKAGPIKHGSIYGYGHRKCRCCACVKANSDYHAAWWRRKHPAKPINPNTLVYRAAMAGLKYGTVWNRVRKQGMSLTQALTTKNRRPRQEHHLHKRTPAKKGKTTNEKIEELQGIHWRNHTSHCESPTDRH